MDLNLNLAKLPNTSFGAPKSGKLSERGYEHLDEVTYTDLSISVRFRIGVTLAYMLESTQYYEVKTINDEVVRDYKKFEGVLLDKFAKIIKIRPEVLKKTVVKMTNDPAMRNEVGQVTFGVLNYLDKHYQTSQIWEVPEPWKLL